MPDGGQPRPGAAHFTVYYRALTGAADSRKVIRVDPDHGKTARTGAGDTRRMTDIPIGDAILTDLRSQALCLKDALASDSDRAVLHAFEAVARARGLTELAADAGLGRSQLTKMVDSAALRDTAGLKQVIASLIERWEAACHDVPAKFSGKDRPESDET
jgi:DNA-binding phage protein